MCRSNIRVSISTMDQDGYKFSRNSNMFVARSRKGLNDPLHKTIKMECTAMLSDISLEFTEFLVQAFRYKI